MKCEEVDALTTRAISGNATAQDEESLREHLSLCTACAQRDARIRKLWNLMGELPPVTLSLEKARTTLSRVSPQALPRRRGLWAVGAAAAAMLVVTSVILLTLPSSQNPAPPTGAVTPAPAGEPQKAEVVQIDETEKTRVDQILTDATPEPQPVQVAPERREPAPDVVKPAPEPKPEPVPAVAQKPPAPADKTAPLASETKPEPAKAPDAAPEPARPTLPTVAVLDRVEGAVLLVASDARVAAKSGQEIAWEQGVEVVGLGSQAVVEYVDGTRLALGADTQVLQLTERKAGTGKRVHMSRGVLAAQVAKQPATETMVFTTPHAEARIMGTRFTLSVTGTTTRIDVKEGRVRFVRKDDGAAVEVGPNQYAVSGKGIALAPKTVAGPRVALKEQFERPNLKWGPGWVQGTDAGSGLRFANENGALSLRVPQKPASQPAPAEARSKGLVDVSRKLVSKGDWVRSIWIETKQTFALSNEAPLRIRARLWQSHSDDKRISWVALNRTVAGQSLLLERRGSLLQLWAEGNNAPLWQKEVPATQEWETLELWVTKDQLAVRRNDLTLHVGAFPFGGKSKAVQISLGGSANLELPQEEEARFDDVEAAWLSRADFEDVIK